MENLHPRTDAATLMKPTFGYKDSSPPDCTFFVPLCVFENGPIGDFKTSSHEARVVWDNGGNIDAAFGVYFYDSTDFRNYNSMPRSSSSIGTMCKS